MDSDPIKVLIAEDNQVDRLLLKKIVQNQGHQVVVACDGEEAIAVYNAEQPQLVLLDALMPKLTGFEVAPKIKTLAGDVLIPIIFLTSLTDAESLAQGLAAGGDDFLSKPYNPTVIKAKVDAFNRMRLNHRQLKKALEDLEESKLQLVEREKMASLGDLVAGIAHEVNTPIGIGVTAVSHLSEVVSDLEALYKEGVLDADNLDRFLEEAKEGLGITRQNIDRAAELIKSFKQVAVDQSNGRVRTINLYQHMQDVLTSLRPQLKKVSHTIDIECHPDLTCTCDAGALTQIVTNLIMNSIIHGFNGIDAGHIIIYIDSQEENIKFTYKDDGVGMPESHLKKIFEPFFTTKRGQGGSGLGTHIIYNQVTQALAGDIVAHSHPGKGIQFDITFPQAAALT